MFTNETIGKFFVLMGNINTEIRKNTTYSGNEGMSIACSQKNEYISDLFHNLGYIGEYMQAGDSTKVYFHILNHIEWFNDLSYTQLSIYKDVGINIADIKSLFEEMKLEVEPFIDKEELDKILEEKNK